MTTANWAGLIVSIIAIVTAFGGSVRWLVKHYLYELKPNSGSSLKDSVIRLEEKVEILYQMMIQKGRMNEKVAKKAKPAAIAVLRQATA
jgi:hypothetical protein